MAKKTCPNGHIYDPNIYGDQCPLCPAGNIAGGSSHPATQIGYSSTIPPQPGMHTQIAATPQVGLSQQGIGGNDASGETLLRPRDAEPKGGNHTVIRRVNQKGVPSTDAPSRKLVGLLVTYNRDPNGRAYFIYEGRNYIGRDASCDISIPDDDQMSGRHMSILYRNVDDKFKFRDEQSSNGTFINKELLDSGELQNYDIVRAGSTLFIFIAIPRI